jgi:hypothetical protein
MFRVMFQIKFLLRTHTTWFTLIVMLLSSPAAMAHGNLDTRPFISGLLHVATAPLCFAIVWGLVAASVGLQEKDIYSTVGMSCIGAVMACAILAWMTMTEQASQAVAATAAAVLGLTAVAGQRLPKPWMKAIAVFAGCTAGLAAQLDHFQWQSAAGMLIALAFVSAASFAALRDLSRWRRTQAGLPLAQRIAGAWIACMGLLILTLTIYPRAH